MSDDSVIMVNPGRPSRPLEAAPPKRYRIGELADHTGLSRQTLHNYTRWGLIQELEWTPGGHRVYGEEAFARLRKIIELKRTCSMQEIREQLKVSLR